MVTTNFRPVSSARARDPQETLSLLMSEQTLAHATGPFVSWHLRRKFEVMDALFRKYLPHRGKIVDIACGRGDALRLAQMIDPDSELWGLDMDSQALEEARYRLPQAKLFAGDMHDPGPLPRAYFDLVHEFGAAFMSRRWDELARCYLSLLKPGGILLWELPERWSLAHISYLMNPAPRASASEAKIQRLWRSLSPSKYTFQSNAAVTRAIDEAGFSCAVVERVTIWNFFCPKILQPSLNRASRVRGDRIFEDCERVTRRIWPKRAGYYLVIRKGTTDDSAEAYVS